MNSFDVQFLGRREFQTMWDYQRSLFDKRVMNEIPDTLIFVEHNPVYTIGRTGSEANILVENNDGGSDVGKGYSEKDERNVGKTPVVHIDRGGDITFHGPGQLVGYPIIKLSDYYLDLHRYLRDLEEVIIRTLAGYNLTAGREKGKTGVWIDGAKIAAIGVKVTRWVTMHGFALNVSTDLNYFQKIIPCGIENCRVTSMHELTGEDYDLKQVSEKVSETFQDVFGMKNKKKELPNKISKGSTI